MESRSGAGGILGRRARAIQALPAADRWTQVVRRSLPIDAPSPDFSPRVGGPLDEALMAAIRAESMPLSVHFSFG